MDFTEEQKQFINHNSLNLILDAPAGAGKTETVAARVQRLHEQGKSVLLICFTHSAERTLQKRLDSAGINVKVRRVVSLAHEIVSEVFGEDAFEIGDGSDLAKEVAVRGVATAKQIIDLEGLIANGAPLPNSMTAATGEVFDSYVKLKQQRQYLSFIDLLLIANGLKQLDVDEIVVDEAQDLTSCHLNMILSFGSRAITLAGDPGQALFGFSGVNPDLFSELVGEGWDKVSLTRSFRVPEGILPAVNVARSTPLSAVRSGGTIETMETDYKGVAVALERVLRPGDAVLGTRSAQLERVASRVAEQTTTPVSRSWDGGIKAGTAQFSTVHSAKGGEWNRVFILDVGAQGIWTPMTVSEEDRRRIFYVAASRALDTLILVKTGDELPWGMKS